MFEPYVNKIVGFKLGFQDFDQDLDLMDFYFSERRHIMYFINYEVMKDIAYILATFL